MPHLRALTPQEIDLLVANFCRCDCWQNIAVAEGFSAEYVRNVNFSGSITLGSFDNEITFFGGVKKHAGIYHATIHNCRIGNNVYIGQIRNYIANYIIDDDVVIENVDMLAVDGTSTFGNGTRINVLDETGGRGLPIFDGLSAHTAYILALYRHRPAVIEKITKMIDRYVASVAATQGSVGIGARLTNCRTLRNLRIGPHAVLDGIYRLTNGTINSCAEAPTCFGPGVIAENFIASTGSTVTQGTEVFDTFIGQGCVLAKQYSAEHSLFFANCQGMHGEACAIFAGPYTVTHHKSTLLIAGYFSFLNAGSGSNQSNHMYKLGPIHQGIVERGSKTTSDSYLLWPAKIGPFTLVMGRHYKHSDTSDLPFSYLIESNDDSILVPGANLRSVGTIRDAQKWPQRDKRTDPNLLDHVNYNLLSPFTVHRMLKALDILQMLQKISGETSDFYSYQSAKIKPSSLRNGLRFYRMAIDKFLGNSLIKRLEKTPFTSNDEIRRRLMPDTPVGTGEWLDLAGLIAPKSEVERLLTDVENGTVASLSAIADRFAAMHAAYYSFEWTWAAEQIEKQTGKPVAAFTAADVTALVEQWRSSVVALDRLLYDDAKKEFSLNARTGFGIDGGEHARNRDFEHVRGEFEQNTFVREIVEHIERKTALGDELIARMKCVENGGGISHPR